MIVDAPEPDYYSPVNREQSLVLNDLLIHARLARAVRQGSAGLRAVGARGQRAARSTARPLVTRGASRRGGALLPHQRRERAHVQPLVQRRPMKVVASDVSRFEREEWVPSVVMAPAERYVVEVRFDTPGRVRAGECGAGDRPLRRRVRGGGRHARHRDRGVRRRPSPIARRRFERPARHPRGIARHRPLPPVLRQGAGQALTLSRQGERAPAGDGAVHERRHRVLRAGGVERRDAGHELAVDESRRCAGSCATTRRGGENMDIDWRVPVGSVVKLRLFNDPTSFHPMQHPIHLHGQRMLVVARDGVRTANMVWKDTVAHSRRDRRWTC